ncbi:MAG TPA: alanine--tRNA ligase [Patescibacteria group bacterium]|nr:alanine--tRNA ligase [Patescibacteria group bacterium]
MTSNELRNKFLEFFKSKGHTIIPSASLVPENDPTALFTTAGMQPLVPYLLGAKHPGGTRVANSQKCIRTTDIQDVGDNRHLTFFEMLGNWSFGDYFKKEAIEWSFEFLTDKEHGLGLNPKRLYATVFKGEEGIPRDDEAIAVWQKIFREKAGMKADMAGNDEIIKDDIRIIPLGASDNFWIAGSTGPCGPDTEIFYDTRPQDEKIEGKFSDFVRSFRLIEIWNNVFMEFNKTADKKYEKLESQNVDTGMGLERTLMALNGKETVFETELFQPIFRIIKENIDFDIEEKELRRAADHLKAAVFIISDGILPSNKDRGYILRVLIRLASVSLSKKITSKEEIETAETAVISNIGKTKSVINKIIPAIFEMYGNQYPELRQKGQEISRVISEEYDGYIKTLREGKKILKKEIFNKFKPGERIPGTVLFKLQGTFGLTYAGIKDMLIATGYIADEISENELREELKKHQELSRAGSEQKFKGGLADHSEIAARYHTATHLLHQALRDILGPHVFQKGSNITVERMRFDFSHPQKMTPEEIKKVEEIVNQKISETLHVRREVMAIEDAKKSGAIGLFEGKYGENVSVYSIGEFSKEICGGPHVKQTGEIGKFKIIKEEAVSAGIRRIKAVIE